MRVRVFLVGLLVPALFGVPAAGAAAAAPAAGAENRLDDVIPAPASTAPRPGADFSLTPQTKVTYQPGSKESKQVAGYLADLIRTPTGFPVPVTAATGAPHAISLRLGSTPRVGDQGYRLDTRAGGVVIRANTGDGLFAGVQTLRQLLPADIESPTRVDRAWTVPGGRIVDHPRFPHRAAMLDLARHFHTPDEVKAYVDEIAQYKVNYLHLHLTDDQGWRIQIDSWPKLAPVGGGPGTGVDGVGGGYLTKKQYEDLVDYAASRHITVVPEIDMPSHTNAALSTYAKLNCDGVAPPPRTDTAVGYSSLCVDKEITYEFVEDVIREVAAMTPGPYLHIGGDEAHATSEADYAAFMQRVVPLVGKYGKRIVGWDEIAQVDLPTSAVPQYWDTDGVDEDTAAAAARGNEVLLSPANKAYLDMKYDENTELGLTWAGYTTVADGYDWDPATLVRDVPETSVLGVEAPLWSETLRSLDDIEFMAFPRLPGIAEIGWSPRASHDWESYRDRLGAQAPRWQCQDVDFYRSPQVDWAPPTATCG